MKPIEIMRDFCLSLNEVTEEPHFEKISFRVKKKIFATYDKETGLACLKFSEIDQNVFSSMDKVSIYHVPNKWGKQGWTFIKLDTISQELLIDALTIAYCQVAPKKLAAQILPS